MALQRWALSIGRACAPAEWQHAVAAASLLRLDGRPEQDDHGRCLQEWYLSWVQELIAGIAGAEVDKLAETHGMDWIDKVLLPTCSVPALSDGPHSS